jgi:hypothetical protein
MFCTHCQRRVSADPIGDDSPRYHARGCVATLTAPVKVFAPCDCAACATGRAWFHCERPVLVAEYRVASYVDEPEYPTKDAIAYVLALHPGMKLVSLAGDASRRA